MISLKYDVDAVEVYFCVKCVNGGSMTPVPTPEVLDETEETIATIARIKSYSEEEEF